MLALPAMFTPLALVVGVARPHIVAPRPALAAPTRAAVIMYWHIYPRDQADSNYQDTWRGPSDGGRLANEYNLEPGTTQALGALDMYGDSPHVAQDQVIAQVAEDGSCCYVYAQGTSPTGWRTRPDEPWTWMQPGEAVTLQSGWKVSLDCQYPESAVYKFEKAGRFLVEEYLAERYIEPAGVGAQLPPGWVTGVDPSTGQQYYYNEQTGASQWDPPQY